MLRAEEAIKNRDSQDFISDLRMAQRAEVATSKWIDMQNAYKKTISVNEKGYDIICYKKDNQAKKIEVKRDFWIDSYKDGKQDRKATNNICVELWSDFIAGNEGWIKYSDSDYIYYVGNEFIYILSTEKLKLITDKLVNFGISKYEEPTLKKEANPRIAKIQYTAHHNGNYKVRSVLINKNWLYANGCILKIINREISGYNKIASFYQI